jgi:hypothetical protein
VRPIAVGALDRPGRRRGPEHVVRAGGPVGLLLPEGHVAAREVPVGERRADALHHVEGLRPAADEDVAAGVLGGEDDRLGRDARRVDRRGGPELDPHLRPGLFEQRGVDGRGGDVGDVELARLARQLQPEPVGEPAHAGLGGRIDRLERQRPDARDRADVDERPAALPLHVGEGRLHPVDLPQQVDPDQAVDLLDVHVLDEPAEADARAIDPGVDPPEAVDGRLRQATDLFPLGDVRRDHDRPAAGPLDLARRVVEGLAVPRRERDARPARPEQARRLPADARRRPRNHDDLFPKRSRHATSPLARGHSPRHRASRTQIPGPCRGPTGSRVR